MKGSNIFFLLLTFLLVTAAGCSGRASAPSSTLNVFAAASLLDAFTEIGALFETAHPGTKVVFNFAGSQQLAQQIIENAPADIFASANRSQMDAVIEAEMAAAGTEQPFASNRLVVIVPLENAAGVLTLQDLALEGLKIVLAAPEVPVGGYSQDFLEKADTDPAFDPGFKEAVIANVVSYEDNVKAVLAKVALGEADAGIVYASDLTGADAAQVSRIEIPDELNVVAVYPIAVLAESENSALAQAFVDLVRSQEGQAILVKYSFLPAPPGGQ